MARDTAPFFLDTAYVTALVNTRDQWHGAAARWEARLATDRRRLLTTEFVLIEIADGLAAVKFRARANHIIAVLQASPLVEVVPASSQLFAAALELYRDRTDKDWGLTDCSSFVVMGERQVGGVVDRCAFSTSRLPSTAARGSGGVNSMTSVTRSGRGRRGFGGPLVLG